MRALLLVVLLVPAVAANAPWASVDDPEGETEVWGGLVNVAAPEMDLVHSDIVVIGDVARVTFRVRDFAFRTFDDEIFSLIYTFTNADRGFGVIHAQVSRSPDLPTSGWCYGLDREGQALRVHALEDGTGVYVDCPMEALHDLGPWKPSSILAMRTDASSWSGGGQAWFRDWPGDPTATAPIDLFATAPAEAFPLPSEHSLVSGRFVDGVLVEVTASVPGDRSITSPRACCAGT